MLIEKALSGMQRHDVRGAAPHVMIRAGVLQKSRNELLVCQSCRRQLVPKQIICVV